MFLSHFQSQSDTWLIIVAILAMVDPPLGFPSQLEQRTLREMHISGRINTVGVGNKYQLFDFNSEI